MKFAVIGCGFSGSIIANELAKVGYSVDLFEARDHIGGNCFTKRDKETGIMLHSYGPHIFHTDDKEVWDYVNNFTKFMPYVNRVKTLHNGTVYSMPINLHTINQFFRKALSPSEAEEFILGLADGSINNPMSFEEQALKFVGTELYEAFLKGYTIKQWGIDPIELPASILKRLPVRFNYDDNYFSHAYQGIPENGYTPIFEKLLDNKNIKVYLKSKFEKSNFNTYDHIFYTGPLDAWFDYKFGRLGYRTLDFKMEMYDSDFQGCAVMNYPDVSVPFTRITEHKYFSPWENHTKSIIFKEYSRNCEKNDIPYYPIRLLEEKNILRKYVSAANDEKHVSFIGRLGTYRYLDMDVTIKEAINASNIIIQNCKNGFRIPVFFNDPI